MSQPIAGEFREIIRPGAFRDSIRSGDAVALWSHDVSRPLARKSAGTLDVREDSVGVRVEIHLPDSEFGRTILESVRRGDVRSMSFGFHAMSERYAGVADDGLPIREILEAELLEVSGVLWPAYPASKLTVKG